MARSWRYNCEVCDAQHIHGQEGLLGECTAERMDSEDNATITVCKFAVSCL